MYDDHRSEIAHQRKDRGKVADVGNLVLHPGGHTCHIKVEWSGLQSNAAHLSPIDCSQRLNQLPLKPVCPMSHSLAFQSGVGLSPSSVQSHSFHGARPSDQSPEIYLVPQSVHRLPEPVMPKSHQLVVGGKVFQRFVFPDRGVVL